MPPQYKDAQVIDFRNAMLGPRGYKMSRKRKIEEKEEQVSSLPNLSLISRLLRTKLSFVQGNWAVCHRLSHLPHGISRWKRATCACIAPAQAEMEANAMQEADIAGVPAQTSKRQKLNIVGIGKVRQLPYQTLALSSTHPQATLSRRLGSEHILQEVGTGHSFLM